MLHTLIPSWLSHGAILLFSVRNAAITVSIAVAEAVATTEGFAIVLCDLKSLLETGKSGGMVRDKAVLIAAGTKE